MQPDSIDIITIIARELVETITPIEKQVLDEWRNIPGNEAYYQELINEEKLVNGLAACVMAGQESHRVEEEIWDRFLQRDIIKASRPSIYWYAAAACLVLVGFAAYFYITGNKEPKAPANITNNQLQPVQPGSDKATLTLADGSTLALDNAKNGIVSTQGNTQVIKEDGEVKYKIKGQPAGISYNTLSTPRGGQYRITLADGSRAWLNAASSIKYPVVFTGNERVLEITGEVYFEVTKNEKMPFRVHTMQGGAEVEVLGTHFNINAYRDEPDIKTTLLEGKIRVQKGNSVQLMKPGQLAKLDWYKDSIDVDSNTDTAQAVAWKNGMFNFNNCDLKTVTRQIARWYNLQVQIDRDVPNVIIEGKMPRNRELSYVLDILTTTSTLGFRENNRTLIIYKK